MVNLVLLWKVLESLFKVVIVLRQLQRVVKQLVVLKAVTGLIKPSLLVVTTVPVSSNMSIPMEQQSQIVKS